MVVYANANSNQANDHSKDRILKLLEFLVKDAKVDISLQRGMNEKGQKMAAKKKELGYSEDEIRKASLKVEAGNQNQTRFGQGKRRAIAMRHAQRKQNNNIEPDNSDKSEPKANKLGLYESLRNYTGPVAAYKYYSSEDGLSNILHILVKGLPAESEFSEKYPILFVLTSLG